MLYNPPIEKASLIANQDGTSGGKSGKDHLTCDYCGFLLKSKRDVFSCFHYFHELITTQFDAKDWGEAITDLGWNKAMIEKMWALAKNKIWELVNHLMG
ncbi:hypothetical protein PVK06_005249 [Gossypium arboreum]|uniref:Uncharacterized protein n=1 Tax=Gossypium arboreum TaxID=29729 RepID=A0ABR0QV71_GOSAR|nr:hypothetical protein PVK06_005249 [Gossypium arboreum]